MDSVVGTPSPSDSAHTDSAHSDEGYTGAGVLPFAHCGNEIFVLLGQERFLSHTGKVSHVWSDFGGRRDDADGGDMLVTAAREFEEETLGLFPPILEVLRSGVVYTPANAATAGAAVSDIGTTRGATRSSTMTCVNGKYRMFVAPVVFIDAFMFNLATQALEQEQEDPAQCGSSGGSSGEGGNISGSVGSNGGGKNRAMVREQSEKLDFCWVPAASLAAVVGCEGSSPNVYVRVGARRLQLFHKFVISLRRGPMTDVLSHMMAKGREPSPSSSSSAASSSSSASSSSLSASSSSSTMADSSTCFAGQRRRRLGIIVPETKRRCNGKQRRRQRQTREHFEKKNVHAGYSGAGGGGGVGGICSTSKVDDVDGAVIGAGGVGGASGEGGAGGASGAIGASDVGSVGGVGSVSSMSGVSTVEAPVAAISAVDASGANVEFENG